VIGARIDELVDEWCRVILFGTRFVEILEISTNADGALFFHDGYRVRNLRRVSDRIGESNFLEFIDFLFDFLCLGSM